MWAESELGECVSSSSKIIKSDLIDRAIKSKDHQIESHDTQQKPSQEAEGVRSFSWTLYLSCQSFPTVDTLYHGIAIVTPVGRVAFMGVFRNIAPFTSCQRVTRAISPPDKRLWGTLEDKHAWV